MREPYTQLHVHLVWSTWDRLPTLTGAARQAAYACIKSDCIELKVEMLAIGGTADHVHVLARIPSTVCVADLVKQIKGASSHLLSHTIPDMDGFRWQGGYGAFTVSKALAPKVREYIQHQEEHHRDGTTHRDHEVAWDA